MEPKVLLMDEPLSNLDAKLREQMRSEIRRIQQLLSITNVYVTHDQIEAMTISDRIIIMNEGRIDQIGTPSDIYHHPQSRFVANFIGRANFLEGVVRDRQDGHLVIDALGIELIVPTFTGDYPTGKRVTVVIRPEMIKVDPLRVHAEGIVQRATFLGDLVEYDVEVRGQKLHLVDTNPLRAAIYSVGETVKMGFLEETLYVLPD
jgi:iron(III) transport system ATP-binding protein